MGGCGARRLVRDLLEYSLVVVDHFLYSDHIFGIVKFIGYVCIQTWFAKLRSSLMYIVVFSNVCRVCTICAYLRVGLSVLFRSGHGLRKDRQIKPLS